MSRLNDLEMQCQCYHKALLEIVASEKRLATPIAAADIARVALKEGKLIGDPLLRRAIRSALSQF